MSADHEEAHTGPIKTPKQFLLTVFLSFVAPIFIIIGLVYFVVSANKPAGSADPETMALGGVSQQGRDQGVAERLARVGSIEIRDANRTLKTGEEVFKAQCTTCHTAGVAGAPKFGNATDWGPRIKTGYAALLNSALHGKNAMPAQGGGDFDDIEVGRAVVYMANAGGASFPVPQPAAAPAPADGASAPAAAASGAAPAPAAAASK